MGKVKAAAKAVEERPRWWPFVPPWALPFVLLVAGSQLHSVWGRTLPWAAVAVLAEAAAAAVLCGVTWRYALPRGTVIQWHSTVTAGLSGAALIALTIFGAHRPLVDIHLGVFGVLAVTWNVRRMEAIKGEGMEDNKDVLTGLGLTVARKKTISATAERAEVKLRLGDGQTVEDVQKVAKQIGSHAGTIRNGVTAIAGDREGDVLLSLTFKDMLQGTRLWSGPMNPGGSIADGLRPGFYDDGAPVMLHLAGNYEKNVAPGHLAIAGMSRTGKGVFARVTVADLCTKRDAMLTGSDSRKGEQFTGPLGPAFKWWASAPSQIKQQLAAIEREMDARNKAIGQAGFDSWTPDVFAELALPAHVHWMEEFAADADDNVRRLIELSEAALSAGIILVMSAQRWSADRVPTSLRYNVANAVCYGVGDEESASMVLSDATLKAGPDPYEWRARFPGRALLEGNGIDPARFPVPWKTDFIDRAPAAEIVSEWAPRMAPVHDIDLKAWGESFERPKLYETVPAVPTSTDVVASRSYDDEEDGYMIPPQPEQEMADEINPRSEIPPYSGPEIDMSPEPQPGERKLSPEERRQAFAQMLAEFMEADPPQYEVTMSDLVDAWDAKVGPSQANQRPFLHDQINARIDLGQMERVEGGRGRYRLLALAEIGHSA